MSSESTRRGCSSHDLGNVYYWGERQRDRLQAAVDRQKNSSRVMGFLSRHAGRLGRNKRQNHVLLPVCDIDFALHNARRFLGGRPRFSTPSRCGAIKGFGDSGHGGGSRRVGQLVKMNKGAVVVGVLRLSQVHDYSTPSCRGSGRHRTTQVAHSGGVCGRRVAAVSPKQTGLRLGRGALRQLARAGGRCCVTC